MTSALQPYQDQRTLSSFKRTLNAALLLRIARGPRVREPIRLWVPAAVVVAAITGPHVPSILAHLPQPW